MRSEVKIGEFKAHLSSYIRSVRSGNEVVIKDRETPVARIVPYPDPGHSERFETRLPRRTLREAERLVAARPKVRIKLKSGELDRAIRETKADWAER